MHKIETVSLIQFQEQNYDYKADHIFFVYSDACASSIGRIGGAQELHLNPECVEEHFIIHEVCCHILIIFISMVIQRFCFGINS